MKSLSKICQQPLGPILKAGTQHSKEWALRDTYQYVLETFTELKFWE
jgi:hypothetical protein